MSYLRSIVGNYDNVLISRGLAQSSRTYLATQSVIWMPPYGVLSFYFQINVDQGDC